MPIESIRKKRKSLSLKSQKEYAIPREGDSMNKKTSNEKSKERIDESEIDWSGFGDTCNKWYEIIHSLNLPDEVVEDDDALEAILRERGYVK